MRGLLGMKPLRSREALILEPAKQVHSFGMTYPIDVLFCDAEWKVRHKVSRMKPRRMTRFVMSSRYALEMAAGEAEEVSVGDYLDLKSTQASNDL